MHCGRLSAEKKPQRSLTTLATLRARGPAGPAGGGRRRPAAAAPGRRAARAGLPVTFAGFLPGRADAGRAAGQRRRGHRPGPAETFGLAALEALACGTPVVVSAESALPEVVGDAGASVAGEDLAAGVRAVLARPERSRRAAARARAEQYDWARPPAASSPRTGPWTARGGDRHDAVRGARRLDHGGHGRPGARGGWRGWAALLASTLPQPELHNLATLGALAADVERAQLPAARPCGRTSPASWSASTTRCAAISIPNGPALSVGRTVAALRAAGAEVLTVRLPDPGQMFGLPGALARPLARRMRAVNAAVDEVARRYGTVHLDAARDPATYERRYWSVDRLHPNERGHRLIACRFHALLAASGFPVGPGPDPEPSSPPPTRLAEVRWMATKGTAWLVRRSRDLVPALVGLARARVARREPDRLGTEYRNRTVRDRSR